jgi:hypothetical protein
MIEEIIFAMPPALIDIRGTIYPPFASSAVLIIVRTATNVTDGESSVNIDDPIATELWSKSNVRISREKNPKSTVAGRAKNAVRPEVYARDDSNCSRSLFSANLVSIGSADTQIEDVTDRAKLNIGTARVV